MPRGKPKTHTLGGRPYVVSSQAIDGYCVDHREGPPYELWINPKLRGKKRLITCIYEARHGQDTDASESTVDRDSEELGELLWSQGYRMKSKRKPNPKGGNDEKS